MKKILLATLSILLAQIITFPAFAQITSVDASKAQPYTVLTAPTTVKVSCASLATAYSDLNGLISNYSSKASASTTSSKKEKFEQKYDDAYSFMCQIFDYANAYCTGCRRHFKIGLVYILKPDFLG